MNFMNKERAQKNFESTSQKSHSVDVSENQYTEKQDIMKKTGKI